MVEELKDCYVFSSDNAACVFGPNDVNLRYIETLLESHLTVRGNRVKCMESSERFIPLMKSLERVASERGEIGEAEIFMEWQRTEEGSADNLSIKIGGRIVRPKSLTQNRFISALSSSSVVIAIGPAGTGKTFLSVAWALSKIASGEKKKIILTRPVVEAGESLGFLPGDLQQKIDPYLRPLYDVAEFLCGREQLKRMEENGTIEAAPLAYMRGRSIFDAVMILDEAQNASEAQLKMFLTRPGSASQVIITGDPSQTDLRNSSALLDCCRILSGIEGLSVIEFQSQDTVRSRIVKDIIEAYERYGSEKEG